ncbi:alpha/beta hydrolase [Kutzneria sp. NPDC051319]|uniref:alpha/beta fold hydrolase n=1 Tax=Kutzneria sp. NPDC051319 TaxID=3155047 RepID=UPI003424CD69
MTENITSAARPAPPTGGFQEIDGRRVFVRRTGSDGPAVVFLPGASSVGLDYFLVQQQVSQFTTAVVYDRGGTGYSDPLPLPRTAAAVATELHELLHAQDIAAPYVMVAHSLGGAYTHRFAQLHPREVAGLVWLDAFHRDWDDFMPAEAALAAGERMAPDPAQIQQMRPALREMYTELVADYPEHLRLPLIDAHTSDEWLQAGFAERGNLVALAEELRAGPDIPDVPLIALTAEGVDPAQHALTSQQTRLRIAQRTLREVGEGKQRMIAALVSAVSHGEQRTVSGVGHSQLCFQRPDVVVQAIRDVVARV